MAWFDWLRKAPTPVIEHPVFGRLRAAHRPLEGPWSWETLDWVDTPRGHVSVTFDAGEGGPTSAHEAQWNGILAKLDELTSAAAPLIASELKDWEVAFDADAPWAEIIWESADLCGDSQAGDEFALGYACQSWPDAMITIYFEGERPMLSRLDD